MPVEFPDLETCRQCGGELRVGIRSSTRFCSTRCRVAAFRRRRRTTTETLARYELGRPLELDEPSPAPDVIPVTIPGPPAALDEIDRWLATPIRLSPTEFE